MAAKKAAGKKPPAKRRPKAKPADEFPPEPWEAQPGESSPAFQAFARYRDLGAGVRTVRRVAQDLSKSGSLIRKWSAEHGWVERAKAWDMHLDRERQRELEANQVEAAERHALVLSAHLQGTAFLQQKFLERLATEEGAKWLNGLSIEDHAQLAIAAARVAPRLVPAERLSLGLSTTNVGGHKGGPLETQPSADEEMAGKSEAELKAFLTGADTARQMAPAPDPAKDPG